MYISHLKINTYNISFRWRKVIRMISKIKFTKQCQILRTLHVKSFSMEIWNVKYLRICNLYIRSTIRALCQSVTNRMHFHVQLKQMVCIIYQRYWLCWYYILCSVNMQSEHSENERILFIRIAKYFCFLINVFRYEQIQHHLHS